VVFEVVEAREAAREPLGSHLSITSVTLYQFGRHISDKSVTKMVISDRKMKK